MANSTIVQEYLAGIAPGSASKKRGQARVRRRQWLQALAYLIPVLLTCAWVLTLPVFPSQDGPLHLYYVNAFGNLLAHKQGTYTDAYYIKAHITPYSSYYYGLIALQRFVSLETADKIMVCTYLILFAISTRAFLRSITPRAQLAPFLILPVLLNWPLFMGFINYSLSTCLALLALAAWSRAEGRTDLKLRIVFLLLVALMMVTHPVPWLLVVCFAAFDLVLRLLRSWFADRTIAELIAHKPFRQDVTTALLACVPYPYLHHFNGMVQTTEPLKFAPFPFQEKLPPLVVPYVQRAQSFVRTFGLDIYAGGSSLARLYRFGITMLITTLIVIACVAFWRSRRRCTWVPVNTWFLFGIITLPFLLFLPDAIGNHFYFISRLGVLFYMVWLAAASSGMEQFRRTGITLATFSLIWWVLTFGMAVRYITPVAFDIATLRRALLPTGTSRPGLLMMPVGATSTPRLNFLPYYWAGASYFRQHGLLLYNTAWLGDPIIPVGLRPDRRKDLDASYYEALPYYGSVLMPAEKSAFDILHSVGFVFMMRQGANPAEYPLAVQTGSSTPGAFARGWKCQHNQQTVWYLCQL